MHPNTFLRTFWRTEFRPEVFVAMSFEGEYQRRFDEVIAPAIRKVLVSGTSLVPNRVDLSRSGDSILTDIMDGICHAELVLADVSTVGQDSKGRGAYRNANVLYEVGIALASRQASEVLLLRDDSDSFLFDVSTVPHMTLDFTDIESARSKISQSLVERINERSMINDARAVQAMARLSGGERSLLQAFARFTPRQTFHPKREGLNVALPLARLLDKQLIVAVATTPDGQPAYRWTRLGYAVARSVADQSGTESSAGNKADRAE